MVVFKLSFLHEPMIQPLEIVPHHHLMQKIYMRGAIRATVQNQVVPPYSLQTVPAHA